MSKLSKEIIKTKFNSKEMFKIILSILNYINENFMVIQPNNHEYSNYWVDFMDAILAMLSKKHKNNFI